MDNKQVEVPTEEDEDDDNAPEQTLLRDPEDLNPALFDPVWIHGEPFQGEIPEDIQEYLDGNPTLVQMIGSARSIFYLTRYDDLVRVIDDLAYCLQDEIVVVPEGCHPGAFLVERYVQERKIPCDVADRYIGAGAISNTEVQVWATRTIPQQITRDVRSYRIGDLYPNARVHCWPESVKCVRVKNQKKEEKFVAEVNKVFDGTLHNKNLLFRGLTLEALAMSLTFFVPVTRSTSNDNDLGPGIYVAENFAYAKNYAGSNGAVMIFKDPDYRGLNVCGDRTLTNGTS
ncbi:hypothetical protein M432DRAFT_44283 [Thermoascus aurantiacus ATCC 26904]